MYLDQVALMATHSNRRYMYLNVTDPVSVVPLEANNWLMNTRQKATVIIVGPTGSGKSSFIEALGLKGTSRISSNGLDGYTQSMTTYRVNNVSDEGRTIYLVDSPGFADSKISELSIVSMLRRWMNWNGRSTNKEQSSISYVHHIFFFTPITSVRLPGSQRRVLKTLQEICGINAAVRATIVTTMWDNIWGEGAATRAERTYKQLESDIWVKFRMAGANIEKFYNTQESALSILDHARGQGYTSVLDIVAYPSDIAKSPIANNLLTDLQNRIQNLHSYIPTLRNELAYAEAQGDDLLASALRPKAQEAEDDLARFSKELHDSGLLHIPPPRSPSPPSPPPSPPHRHIAPSRPPSPPLRTSFPPSNSPQPPQPSPTPGRFLRVLQNMKCWGNAVGGHHED